MDSARSAVLGSGHLQAEHPGVFSTRWTWDLYQGPVVLAPGNPAVSYVWAQSRVSLSRDPGQKQESPLLVPARGLGKEVLAKVWAQLGHQQGTWSPQGRPRAAVPAGQEAGKGGSGLPGRVQGAWGHGGVPQQGMESQRAQRGGPAGAEATEEVTVPKS